jgi:hypothetical protein
MWTEKTIKAHIRDLHKHIEAAHVYQSFEFVIPQDTNVTVYFYCKCCGRRHTDPIKVHVHMIASKLWWNRGDHAFVTEYIMCQDCNQRLENRVSKTVLKKSQAQIENYRKAVEHAKQILTKYGKVASGT